MTAREAAERYCSDWIWWGYCGAWPRRNAPNLPGTEDGTEDEREDARQEVSNKLKEKLLLAFGRGEEEEPSTPNPAESQEVKPKREPAVLKTGDLGSDSEPVIMAGSFLGTYGVLDINTAGHWTYRASERRLRELKENGPNWFAHYDRFSVTHEDGSVQTLTITLSRHRNDEVKETKAFPTVDNRVPVETFGENNEPNLGLATVRDFFRKLPDPDQFDGSAPGPLWVAGQLGINQPLIWLAFDDIRIIEFNIEANEASGDGRKFVGLRFYDAAERLPVDETKGSDKAALTDEPTPTPDLEGGTPAPPPKKRGGGPKRGPYYRSLVTHLKWRKDNRDDLDTASLADLRKEARNRLTTDKIKGIPKSRSGLDDAIRAALRELDVNR